MLDRIKYKIPHGNKSFVYEGPAQVGELTMNNGAVLLQDRIARTLNAVNQGIFKLPDDQTNGSSFVSTTANCSPQRRELLVDLISDQLLTHHQMTSGEPVIIYSIAGKRIEVEADEVTITEWLRLLVREAALVRGAATSARHALDSVVLKPAEAWPTAAARLVLMFRAATADPDMPHASEAVYFWRYISERNLVELLDRIRDMLLPNALDRISINVLMHQLVADIALKL